MITLIQETGTTEVKASPGDALWLNADDMAVATGWQLKPEGFCKGDVCVPVPGEGFVEEDRVNLSRLWQHMGKPVVSSEAGDAWSLGEDAGSHNTALATLEAPDFTLPDLSGKLHSLTDFRL